MDPRKEEEALLAIEEVLVDLGIKYKKPKEEGVFSLRLTGSDIAIPINLWVEAEYSLLMVGSVLPFKVKSEKREDMAVILNILNARIINGAFYLDPEDHYIKFKITDCYLGAPPSKEAIKFNVALLIRTVDKYNDKLLAFNEGKMDRVYFTTCI